MSLIYTLAWMELRRLRIHGLLLAISAALLILWLGIDFGHISDSNFTFESSTNSSDPDISEILRGFSGETVLTMLSIAFPTLGALSFGFLFAVLTPFRSPQEWEQGQFQMLKMSSWTQYQIQIARYLIYSVLLLCYSLIIILAGSVAIATSDINLPHLVLDTALMSIFMVLSSIPLLIGIGMVVDATRTAYYLRGIHFVITFIQFAGWISLGYLSLNSMSILKLGVIPPIPIKTLTTLPLSSYNGPTHIFWEPMIMSCLLGIAFVVLSGRIQEEAEA